MEQLRVCKNCLLRDNLSQEEIYRSIQARIESLEVDVRASATLYEARLARCMVCDMLLAGMCRVCGCYIELRAAKAQNACPRGYWTGVNHEEI